MTDWFNLTVSRLHGVPEGWHWHSVDAHAKPEDFIVVTGAVPCGIVSRGPRKGNLKWPRESQAFWIRMADINESKLLWERETGKCHQCENISDPCRKDHPCKRCKGTGLAASH